MHESERAEFGKMLLDVFRGLVIGIVVFALMVTAIFLSSEYEWNQQVKRLELEKKRIQLEQIAKADVVGVYAWVNEWGTGFGAIGEERHVEKLVPGVEYIVGQLRKYDVNEFTGFNNIKMDPDDDMRYMYPVVTFNYSGWVNFRHSINNGSGWLYYGPTAKGLKTGNWQYLPSEDNYEADASGWGNGATSLSCAVNGRDNLYVNLHDKSISDDMRRYNYCTTLTLGELFENVPEKYADREREIWISHIVVDAYNVDPREAGNGGAKPEVSFLLRIRHYGNWDITQEEYDELIFIIPDISGRNASEYTTIELVIE